jgi:DNA-binding CsgD family transcriptional regulator
MPGIRLSDYEEVHSASNRGELQACLLKFAGRLEFERFNVVLVDDRPGKARSIHTIGNTPAAYEAISSDASVGLRDPVAQRLKTERMPFAYDQSTYVTGGAADLWETQAPFGYSSGISVALHTGTGMHFYAGFDRSHRLPANEIACTRLLADLHMLAACAQEAACRVFSPFFDGNRPFLKLTPRERDCLSWAYAGKSAWDVGMILGISAHTVEFHWKNARQKLGMDNTQLAAIRAMELRLIS